MPPRRLLLSCLLLAACPPRTPSERPPDDASPAGNATTATAAAREEPLAHPAPDDPDGPDEPGELEPSPPGVSSTRGDNDLADTLAPRALREPSPSRRSATTGCEGGSRRVGASWMLECNRCTCGDDGQSTCTTIACDPHPR